jgi:hypothetical protein
MSVLIAIGVILVFISSSIIINGINECFDQDFRPLRSYALFWPPPS